MTADYYIEKLQLQRHPEGGYFRETYRSSELIAQNHLPKRFKGDRCMGTAIYFLLQGNEFSAFHKILSDETWHFYAGTTVTVYMIDEIGNYSSQKIGNDMEAGEMFQFTVPANTWFASEVNDKNSFCLVGCTVAPGFDFADFKLADKQMLLQQFPQHKAIIEKYCIR
jgi:predicted cupin superfamily sugar epimerase